MSSSRFELAKVYQIVCLKTNKRYIGSTTQKYLSSRLASHVNCFQKYLAGAYTYYSVFEVLQNDDFDIFLLESFPCSDINELRRRERYYIETTDCVNKNLPGRTKHEWNNTPNECLMCGGKYTNCHRNSHARTLKHILKEQTCTINEDYTVNTKSTYTITTQDNEVLGQVSIPSITALVISGKIKGEVSEGSLGVLAKQLSEQLNEVYKSKDATNEILSPA